MSEDDDLDDFVQYDATMGADMVKCPYCGASVTCSPVVDDDVECPECGRNFTL